MLVKFAVEMKNGTRTQCNTFDVVYILDGTFYTLNSICYRKSKK